MQANALSWYICLTYCFPFLSVIAALFDVTSRIFTLKNFNCSNSFVPLPFMKLGHKIVINLGHSLTIMKIVKRCILENYIFRQHFLTIDFIESFRFCFSLIPLWSYLWYPLFFVTLPNFHVVFAFIVND